jgi:hypothetical protein
MPMALIAAPYDRSSVTMVRQRSPAQSDEGDSGGQSIGSAEVNLSSTGSPLRANLPELPRIVRFRLTGVMSHA